MGYNGNDEIIHLITKLPQMIGYYICFFFKKNNEKKISFKCNDKKLLKNTKKYGNKLVV